MSPQPNQWYLSRGGKEHGPFSDADLANFSSLGQLQANDLIWREGFTSWRPATTIFPKRTPAPVGASVTKELIRVRGDAAASREVPLSRGGLTWTKALIALACSAAIGAGSGYVFKHFPANVLTQTHGGP
jgi:hypothetical protein